LSKFDETRLRDQLLFSMKVNDKNKKITFSKRAVSDDLEVVTSKKFSGGKPPGPYVLIINL